MFSLYSTYSEHIHLTVHSERLEYLNKIIAVDSLRGCVSILCKFAIATNVFG